MTYSEALKYIHSLNRFGIKPGLERITALLLELGNPQDSLSFIHVAGTNGKGSTSTAISNIMQAAGKKTGLFISPYVIDFTERVQINGSFIEREDLAELTARIMPVAEKVVERLGDAVTEFEFITALAFLYFKEQKCDVVVLETGLGGRLDSTNVIKKPLAAVITKIALDHIAVLGNTLGEIAAEKCGIIKSNVPVITVSTQDDEAMRVIETKAKEKNAPLIIADIAKVQKPKTSAFGSRFIYKDLDIVVSMPGEHQIENMTLSAEASMALSIERGNIISGIGRTSFPARLEVLQKEPLVLLDGAHNKNGADVLSNYLDTHNLKPVVLMGMMQDKDCNAVVSLIASRANSVVTVKVEGNPRSASADELKILASKYCRSVVSASDYQGALKNVFEVAKSKQLPVLICGSLYLASDIRQMAIDAIGLQKKTNKVDADLWV